MEQDVSARIEELAQRRQRAWLLQAHSWEVQRADQILRITVELDGIDSEFGRWGLYGERREARRRKR